MTAVSAGKVLHELLNRYGAELKEAAGNTVLSRSEQPQIGSKFLQAQLDEFRQEHPGRPLRVNNVAGSFTGHLEVVLGNLLEPAEVPGRPYAITSKSVAKIPNAEVRSLARLIINEKGGAGSIDSLMNALDSALAAAESSFDPISDGQHFTGQKLPRVTSFGEALKEVEAAASEESDLSLETLEGGKKAVYVFDSMLQNFSESALDDDESVAAVEKIREALTKNTANVQDALLVHLSSTGPQYGRETDALILKGRDGSFYLLQNEFVG